MTKFRDDDCSRVGRVLKILGVNQAAVSKLERRTDMYVSTLLDFVKAMDGELKITARFPDRGNQPVRGGEEGGRRVS
jgi:hypothetical protein